MESHGKPGGRRGPPTAHRRAAIGGAGRLSARSQLLRAAEFYATHNDPRQIAAWRASRDCFAQAAPLLRFPAKQIEVSFDGAHLPGYFVRGGSDRAPTLIAMSGFDGSAEEVYYWIGPAAAERGWNCLMFEGPGQRGALHLNPGLVLRPDYEAPVGAVVDYALSRPEVDPARLALLGYSLGGFLAVRAAAFEPRIRAVVANSLVVDVGAAFAAVWPKILHGSFPSAVDTAFNLLARFRPDTRWGIDHARWALGVEYPHDFFAAWKPFTLWGTEDRLTTPLLCMVGEDEIAQSNDEMITQTIRYLRAVRGPAELAYLPKETGASSHCQMGGLAYAHTAIFEWLNRTVTSEPPKRPRHHPQLCFPMPSSVPSAAITLASPSTSNKTTHHGSGARSETARAAPPPD